MISFAVLRHPLPSLVTAFKNTDKLNNDLLIFNPLWVMHYDVYIKCSFSIQGNFSESEKTYYPKP